MAVSGIHGPAGFEPGSWRTLPQTRLPNGLQIRYVSRRDVAFLYREIYQEQNYLRGLSLSKGDTVLDIGANIGLFGLRAAETVGASVRKAVCMLEAASIGGILLHS